MKISYAPLKDATNLAKHGLSLALATELEWETALIWTDNRKDYGEIRQSALGVTGGPIIFYSLCGSHRYPTPHQLTQGQ